MSISKYFSRFANRVVERKAGHEANIIQLLSRQLAALEAATGNTTIDTTITNVAGRNGAVGVCARLSASPTAATWTGDVTGLAAYLHPYGGNVIELYDGDDWQAYALTAPVQYVIPAGVSAHSLIDLFAYATAANAVALEGVVWSTTAARSVSLATQDGVYVKNGDPTRRYMGTIQVNAAVGDKLQDTVSILGVWNYYHRLPRVLLKDKTGSWGPAGASLRVLGNDTSIYVHAINGVADADNLVESWVRAETGQQESESTTGYYAAIDFDMRAGIGVSGTTIDGSDYLTPHRQIMPTLQFGTAGGTPCSIFASAGAKLAHAKLGSTRYYALEYIDSGVLTANTAGTNGGVRSIQWA